MHFSYKIKTAIISFFYGLITNFHNTNGIDNF